MARKRKHMPPSVPVTRQGPLGPVTENPDGSVDITLDHQKFHDHAIAQHKRVLADIDAAAASGYLPKQLADELRKHGEAQLAKAEARPVNPNAKPSTLRLKGK